MYHDVSQCITMYHDVSRCITMYHHVSKCIDIYRYVSKYIDIDRYISKDINCTMCPMSKSTITQILSSDYLTFTINYYTLLMHECCGTYPSRYPYGLNGNRECCGGLLYNPNVLFCCSGDIKITC